LLLHTTWTRKEAGRIVSVVIGVPFVEMLDESALEIARLTDVDELAECFELVNATLRGHV